MCQSHLWRLLKATMCLHHLCGPGHWQQVEGRLVEVGPQIAIHVHSPVKRAPWLIQYGFIFSHRVRPDLGVKGRNMQLFQMGFIKEPNTHSSTNIRYKCLLVIFCPLIACTHFHSICWFLIIPIWNMAQHTSLTEKLSHRKHYESKANGN